MLLILTNRRFGLESPSASCSDSASPDGDAILDDVKVSDGPRVLDTKVYESEKWGGGRLIWSGLKVARLKVNSSKTLKLWCLGEASGIGNRHP